MPGKPVINPDQRIQGGSYCMRELSLIHERHIGGYLTLTDEEAMDAARRLAKEEGIF